MTTNTPELKPCPFCGGKAVIQDGGFNHYRVACEVCSATKGREHMHSGLSVDKLRNDWNHRAGETTWQPISSAPRDGNEYLGWFPELNERRVIWWCAAENFSAPLKNNVGGFWNSSRGSTHQPTHWKPLDLPPTGENK